jgi:hypothetical protein
MRWLKRIRGALLMGITWALVWAPIGPIIGFIVDRDGKMDEPWIAVGALPGFFAGVVFSILLGIVGRRHRFEDFSLRRFATWGAGAGLIMGTFPFLAGDLNPALPVWFPVVVIGSIVALASASASASLVLARKAERASLAAGDVPHDQQLTP